MIKIWSRVFMERLIQLGKPGRQELNEDNPEVKNTVTVSINKVDDEEIVSQILNRFPSWYKMRSVMP